MATKTTKQVYLFTLHGHVESEPMPYSEVFYSIKELPPDEKVQTFEEENRVLVLSVMRITQGRAYISVFDGDPKAKRQVYDFRTSSEVFEDVQEGRMDGTATRMVVDLATQLAAVEYNRKGAKAIEIANFLRELSHRTGEWGNVTMALVERPAPSFVNAIDQFERIRVVSVSLARSNPGWEDQADRLTEIARDSNADEVDTVFRAARGKALSTEGGIVEFLKNITTYTNRMKAIVKKATVTGRKKGESAESDIKLESHQEKSPVRVPVTDGGLVATEAMFDALDDVLTTKLEQAETERPRNTDGLLEV